MAFKEKFKNFLYKFLGTKSIALPNHLTGKNALFGENSLFKNLTPNQYELLAKSFKEETYHKDNIIIHEGDDSQTLYIIVSGSVEAVKKTSQHQTQYSLNQMSTGESFGEVSLLDKQKRSASIRALSEVRLLILEKKALLKIKKNHPEIYTIFMENLSERIATRLRQTNETIIKEYEEALTEAKERTTVTILMTYIVFYVTLYSFLFGLLTILMRNPAYITTTNLISGLVFSIATTVMIYHTKIPLQYFGFQFKKPLKIISLTVAYTTGLILAIFFIKSAVLYLFPHFNDAFVFNVKFHIRSEWGIFLYAFSAIFQEIIIRAGIQSPLLYALPASRYKNAITVLISTIMFVAFHGHVSFIFGLVVFIPSIIWGILFIQTRSLVSVCLSHAVVGILVLYFLQNS